MKNLNELCEGILDADLDVTGIVNGFQAHLLQHINPDKSGRDFMKLDEDDPQRYDAVQAIINQLRTYPTISSTEAKKRIKAGDMKVVGIAPRKGIYSDIFDIYLFNHDGTTWTNRFAAASKHVHLTAIINSDKLTADIHPSTRPCNRIDSDIDKFYDCSI